MPDKRTKLQKMMFEKLGPPLYYCKECMLEVDVKQVDGDVKIKRPDCCDCNCEIIAPRKCVLIGEGKTSNDLSLETKLKIFWQKLSAALTGRCV